MTQVWPGFGEAPVPSLMSTICKPDAVVMGFPCCAVARVAIAAAKPPSMVVRIVRRDVRITVSLSLNELLFEHDLVRKPVPTFRDHALVTERAAVLARIGAAGERALVPVYPDRLAAAERADDAGGLVAELLQPFDDGGRHAVL